MHALRKTISIAWKNYKLFMPIPNEHSPPPRQKSNDPPLRTQQTKPANNSIVLVSKTDD